MRAGRAPGTLVRPGSRGAHRRFRCPQERRFSFFFFFLKLGFCFSFFPLFFWGNHVLCNPGWTRTHCVAKDDFEPYPGVTGIHYFRRAVLEMEHRASCMLSKHSTDWGPFTALGFTVHPKLVLNFVQSCLSFPSAGMTGVSHQAKVEIFIYGN